MQTIEDIALELAVFNLVDHSIDKDTHDLTFTTTTTNGFESTTIVDSNNPDYHKIVSLIARKSHDTVTNNVSANKAGKVISNKGGNSSYNISQEPVIIIYDRAFNDYTHDGGLIYDLEKFLAICLEHKKPITIKELS